ncbi:MAG: DUF3732 domain-containing protein [Clostridium butyricum]|nr:DUF3732 domain-containing protein [Clostridium butyricum]
MKIKNIILWPKDETKKKQIIDFDLDKINIITGWSERGKSAIIPIIDYCLCSEKCSIPVGVIREKTGWFGLLIQLKDSQLLLARKEPGQQEQSSEMYMDQDIEVSIIDKPYKRTSTDLVKQFLNNIANITNVNISGEENEKNLYLGRPSFRDMSAFEFQPQHIVANPYTLFFKADSSEHREKLKNIFPYILGAEDNNTLIWRRQLKDLRKELEKKTNLFEIKKKSAQAWLGDVRAYYSLAKELGLIKKNEIKENMDINYYIEELRNVVNSKSGREIYLIPEGATKDSIEELISLKNEEEKISNEISLRRFKLSKLESLLSSEHLYEQYVGIQQKRLAPVGWFKDKVEEYNCCPICKSVSTSAKEKVDDLLNLLDNISSATKNFDTSYDLLDKETAQLKKELIDLESKINIIRTHKQKLENSNKSAEETKQTTENIFRFLGRLELSLENLDNITEDNTLSEQIQKLKKRISNLEEKVDESTIKSRTNNALYSISKLIRIYGKCIGVDRYEDTAELSIADLNIKIKNNANKWDYLWEIGSGANWMGYHISTLLAIHEFLLTLEDSHVPSFLVIDQPSQVFFPEKWSGEVENKVKESIQNQERLDDMTRTHNIFSTLKESITRNKGSIQIIVLDHADEEAWKNIDVKVAGRWRGEEALIPKEWI